MEYDPLDAVAWAAWWLNDTDLATQAAEATRTRRATGNPGEPPAGSPGGGGAGGSSGPSSSLFHLADGRGHDGACESVDGVGDGRRLASLSPREIEVLGLVVEGLGDKVIARRLHISGHTVHRHLSNILTKLDVPSRAGAAALAARHGLSPPRL